MTTTSEIAAILADEAPDLLAEAMVQLESRIARASDRVHQLRVRQWMSARGLRRADDLWMLATTGRIDGWIDSAQPEQDPDVVVSYVRELIGLAASEPTNTLRFHALSRASALLYGVDRELTRSEWVRVVELAQEHPALRREMRRIGAMP